MADGVVAVEFAADGVFCLATKGTMCQPLRIVRIRAIFVMFLPRLPATAGAAMHLLATATLHRQRVY